MSDSAAKGSSAEGRRLHLRAWHRDRGAVWGVRRGCRIPLHYGEPGAELERLRSGCALVDQSDADRLEVLGEDRRRFLNGLVTLDVAALADGQGAYGYVTEAKGRIVADVTVLEHADRSWLHLPPGRGDAVGEHLLRYRVADRVEVLPMEDLLPLTLAGGGLAEALRSAGVEPPAREESAHGPGRFSSGRVTWFGTELHVAWTDRMGTPALVAWVSSSIASAVADELLERLDAGVVGHDACEVLRLEAGIPRYGVDFDSSNLPGEVGTVGAVDWKKGCYLGQEIVARLHYRGQPARVLRRLRVSGDELPKVGSPVVFEERAAGTVTSVVRSPMQGVLALAMLQRRAGDPGTVVGIGGVEVDGGGAAEIGSMDELSASVEALASSE